MRTLTLLICLSWIVSVQAFVTRPALRSTVGRPHGVGTRQWQTPNDDEDEQDWMDQQFFDPESVPENSPFYWLAQLVQRDYNTAEALLAGLYFVILIVGTQEVLRMQLYGDSYIPFQAGSAPGRLF